MTPHELRGRQRAEPFTPFRIELRDGTTHEVRDPDWLMVGLWHAYVGIAGQSGDQFPDRAVRFELAQVARLGPVGRGS